MSSGPWQRWRALVAEHGSAAVAVLYVLHRVLQRASGGRAAIVPYLLVAQPLGAAGADTMRPDADTTVFTVGPGHELLAAFPRPPAVNAARFASGAECHVACVKGRFAGHIWIARGGYVEDEVQCRYTLADPAGCVWDYDVYVEPRYRLGRTMARLWQAVDRALAAQGARFSCSRINRFNAASVKSHQRLGAQTVGRALFVVIGPLQLAGFGRAPFVHVQFGAGAGPRLVVRPPAHG
jgi:hypothetical protein